MSERIADSLSRVALHTPVLSGPFQPVGLTPVELLWGRLVEGDLPLTVLDYAESELWPYTHALLAAEPDLWSLDMDTKQLRATEKSMRLCIAAARGAEKAPWWLAEPPPPDRSGLYLGLPSIEDAAPNWEVLVELSQSGEGPERLGHYAMRTGQPMVGLIRLNSTLTAHLSNALHLGGANAGFSPFADAGVQALIEAVLSIAEGENDVAFAGGTAMSINETAALQWRALGLSRFNVLAGEGAGMLRLERCPAPTLGAIRVSGFGRCFQSNNPVSALAHAVDAAIDMSGEKPGWVISDLAMSDSTVPCQLPLASRIGWLGGAHAVTALALATRGLERQQCLVARSAELWRTEDLPLRSVVIAGCGPHGQAAAITVRLDDLTTGDAT